MRSDTDARTAFQTVFTAMVGVLERNINGDPRTRRTRAEGIAAMCVGGMVVARAMADRPVADGLRDGCMAVALELGGWRAPRSANGHVTRTKQTASRT
jgi:hypothetical protein